VLVTGAGPVGLLTVAVLGTRGVHDITVSEPAPKRRDRARAVGATRVITPDDLSSVPIGQTAETPYAVAFECSGHARAAEAALARIAEQWTDSARTLSLSEGIWFANTAAGEALAYELAGAGLTSRPDDQEPTSCQ